MENRLITRDDIIKAGACADGVYEWATCQDITATALPATALLRYASADSEVYIKQALGLIGNGFGLGNGDGFGCGGCGNGYGGGDGDGGGIGNGSGNGFGNGDGFGCGGFLFDEE